MKYIERKQPMYHLTDGLLHLGPGFDAVKDDAKSVLIYHEGTKILEVEGPNGEIPVRSPERLITMQRDGMLGPYRLVVVTERYALRVVLPGMGFVSTWGGCGIPATLLIDILMGEVTPDEAIEGLKRAWPYSPDTQRYEERLA